MAELAPHDKDAVHEAYVAQINLLFGILCNSLVAAWNDSAARERARERFLTGVRVARHARAFACEMFAELSKGVEDGKS